MNRLKNKINLYIEEHRVLNIICSLILFIFKCVRYGCFLIFYYWKLSILLLVVYGILLFNNHKEMLFNFLNNEFIKNITFNSLYKDIYIPLYSIEVIIIVLLIIWLCKNNKLKDYKHNQIQKVNNFENAKKETPFIVGIKKEFNNFKLTTLIFNANAIGFSTWKDNKIKEDLETALNRTIINIESIDRRKDRIKVDTISPKYKIKDVINFEENIVSPNNFEIVLGENIKEQVKINLDIAPHTLIGGTTGSGKSVIMNCIAYQCAKKGAIVHFADLKGLDFNSWNNKNFTDYNYLSRYRESDINPFLSQCRVFTDIDSISTDLGNLRYELAERKIVFARSKYKNINEYNSNNPDKPLSRIVFIFDEFEAINNEDKNTAKKIISDMTEFATRGRAFGIHLIVGCQRPDADTVMGQIKSNLDNRICGRSSDIYVSEIVLGKGNYDAHYLINENEKGAFIFNNQKFKAYYLDTSFIDNEEKEGEED